MLNKTFEIELNTKHQGSQTTDIIVSQGDTRSVVFNFRVYDDVAFAALFILKSDRNVVQLTASAKQGGGFTVMLSRQAVAEIGRTTGAVALYGHTGERITTLFFDFTIIRDIVDGDIVKSLPEFDALGKAVAILEWLIEQKEQFPQLNVLGRFETEAGLKDAFPDGTGLGGGFWVGSGQTAEYWYWSMNTGSWENVGAMRTGPQGKAATIEIGTTTDVSLYDTSKVENVGDEHAAVLNFYLRQGIRGETGENGITPHIGANGNWWIGAIDT